MNRDRAYAWIFAALGVGCVGGVFVADSLPLEWTFGGLGTLLLLAAAALSLHRPGEVDRLLDESLHPADRTGMADLEDLLRMQVGDRPDGLMDVADAVRDNPESTR